MVMSTDGRIAYSWRCSECGRVKEESYEFSAGSELHRPDPPLGWTKVNDWFVCDAHRVSVLPRGGTPGGVGPSPKLTPSG